MNPKFEKERTLTLMPIPMAWGQCLACGSPDTVAKIVKANEVAKGKMRAEIKAAFWQLSLVVVDDQRIGQILSAPALTALFDICADCGILYCVHVDCKDVPLSVKVGKPPKMPGMGS